MRLPRRPLLACLVLVALVAAPAGADAKLFKLVREDIRVKLNVKGERIVSVHIRARERCGETDAVGFAKFVLREEPIVIRPGGRFHYGASFDDARGFGSVVLDGTVHRRRVSGFFSFKNNEGVNCGTGRPGDRKVHFTAR